jgi:hypothetical protein
MASEKEQKGYVSNPFLNPIGFWQSYLINWIQASRGYYESAIKPIEYSFKVWWDPWLRAAQGEKKYPMKKTDVLKRCNVMHEGTVCNRPFVYIKTRCTPKT